MLKNVLSIFLLFFLCSCSFVFDSIKMDHLEKETKYNIAVLLPLSGKYSQTGQNLLNTIHFAYNKNPNPNVLLNIYDTGGKADKMEELTKELLEDNNKAVLGPLLSSETLALSKHLKPHGIPIFTLSNDETILDQVYNVYMLSTPLSTEIKTTIDYLHKNLESENFALLIPQNDFGNVTHQELQKYFNYFGTPLVKEVTYPTNSTRLLPYIKKLILREELEKYEEISKKLANKEQVFDEQENLITIAPSPKLEFDTLVILDYGQRVPILISHLSTFGIDTNNIRIVGLSLWNNSQIKNNRLLRNTYFSTLNDFNDSPIVTEYMEYYDTPLNRLNIVAYDGIVALMSLVYRDSEGALVDNFTPSKISSIKLDGLAGTFEINKDKTTTRKLSLRQINNTKDGLLVAESIDPNNLRIEFLDMEIDKNEVLSGFSHEKEELDLTFSTSEELMFPDN